jgi:hypothetical protein
MRDPQGLDGDFVADGLRDAERDPVQTMVMRPKTARPRSVTNFAAEQLGLARTATAPTALIGNPEARTPQCVEQRFAIGYRYTIWTDDECRSASSG